MINTKSFQFLIFDFDEDSEDKKPIEELNLLLNKLHINCNWIKKTISKQEVLDIINKAIMHLSENEALFILFNAHGVSEKTEIGLEGMYKEGIVCLDNEKLWDSDLNVLYEKHGHKSNLLFLLSNGCNNADFFINLSKNGTMKRSYNDFSNEKRSINYPELAESNITFISNSHRSLSIGIQNISLTICGISISKETDGGSSDNLYKKLNETLRSQKYASFNEFVMDFFQKNDYIRYTVFNTSGLISKMYLLNKLIQKLTYK